MNYDAWKAQGPCRGCGLVAACDCEEEREPEAILEAIEEGVREVRASLHRIKLGLELISECTSKAPLARGLALQMIEETDDAIRRIGDA